MPADAKSRVGIGLIRRGPEGFHIYSSVEYRERSTTVAMLRIVPAVVMFPVQRMSAEKDVMIVVSWSVVALVAVNRSADHACPPTCWLSVAMMSRWSVYA